MNDRTSYVEPFSEEFGDEWDDLEKAQRRQADDLMQVRDAFRHIFTLPQGEIAIAYLYNFCHQGTTTFVQGDPGESARREGMRRVYLQMAGFVALTDEKVFGMIQSQTRERDRR